jgi:hypothetical protein
MSLPRTLLNTFTFNSLTHNFPYWYRHPQCKAGRFEYIRHDSSPHPPSTSFSESGDSHPCNCFIHTHVQATHTYNNFNFRPQNLTSNFIVFNNVDSTRLRIANTGGARRLPPCIFSHPDLIRPLIVRSAWYRILLSNRVSY